MIHKMPIIDFEKVKETRKDIYETTWEIVGNWGLVWDINKLRAMRDKWDDYIRACIWYNPFLEFNIE
jgi:hypothetical protein